MKPEPVRFNLSRFFNISGSLFLILHSLLLTPYLSPKCYNSPMSSDTYHDWVAHPVGDIPKDTWCEHCMRYNARVSTITVIGIKGSKVLMVLRKTDPQKGFWSFPGGYLSWDETTKQAGARELKEETGYQAKNLKLHGVYSDPKRDLDGRQNVDHCYIAEIGDQGDERDDVEVEAIKWFNLDDLPDKIAFDHRQMIEDYKKEN